MTKLQEAGLYTLVSVKCDCGNETLLSCNTVALKLSIAGGVRDLRWLCGKCQHYNYELLKEEE